MISDVAHDFRAAVEVRQDLFAIAERGEELVRQCDRQRFAGADPQPQRA